MATMIDGESYLGRVMIRPLSTSGDVKIYLWPLRCLKSKMGGPTFGVDVNGVEILRFDTHGPRGHWHKGGYDKLGAGGSHTEFPDEIRDTPGQISWSLAQIKEQGQQMLDDAGTSVSLDGDLIDAASEAIMAHLESEGDLRSTAITQGVLVD